MISSENRVSPRIKSGAGFFGMMLYGSASSAAAVASMASAEAASDQCTPIKLPRSPTDTTQHPAQTRTKRTTWPHGCGMRQS